MLGSQAAQRRVGRYAWVMAWVGLVLGQLHALARHNTEDGREDLNLPLTRLWSDPARDALAPLLTWADADTVYLTYGKIWFPVFLGFTLCALVIRRRRRPAGFEKLAWTIAVVAYVWACIGVFLEYYTQWVTYNAFFEVAFVIAVPAILLMLVGNTLLGIALLREGVRPRSPAWLLALTIPLVLVIMQFTSLGNVALPTMFAFAIFGRHVAREPVPAGS